MNRKPKVFIVGISGFLGYHLALHLQKDFLVTGACFSNQVFLPDAQIYPISLKSADMLETLVRVQSPDFVINAMAITNREEIEANQKLSDNINIMMAVSLASLANKLRAQIIHLSCAEVYDGYDGNYKEEDNDFSISDPYGKQKIAAESYVRAQTLESTILRVGRVMGIGNPYRPSEFDRIRSLITNGKPVLASRRKTHSYLSVNSFCQAMHLIMTSPFPGKHRLFNLGGASLTDFEFIQGWGMLMNADAKLVKPIQEDSKRNLSMSSELFAKTFPAWKPESDSQLYVNLLKSLTPGIGVKKWQKILQTQ